VLLRRVVALILSLALFGVAPLDALAQSARHKKKKSNKPKPVPCRTGCTPDTSAPEITSATAEDELA
jgi:hypothetical protein